MEGNQLEKCNQSTLRWGLLIRETSDNCGLHSLNAEADAKSIVATRNDFQGFDPVIDDLSSKTKNHARDVSSWLRKHKLSWDIPVSTVEVDGKNFTVLDPVELLEYLVETGNLSFMMGGVQVETSRDVLCQYWHFYRFLFPNLPLWDLARQGLIDLGSTIPSEIHMDGGTGFKKSEVMVASLEPTLGQGTRATKNKQTSNTVCLKVNVAGNSFENRCLYGVIQKKYYDHGNDHVLLKWTEEFAKRLHRAFYEGFLVGNRTFRVATLGTKGDCSFVAKVGCMNRSHGNIRKTAAAKNPIILSGCCWRCEAGMEHAPFEDVSVNALWTKLGPGSAPWSAPGPLMQFEETIDPQQPAEFYRMDDFHVTHKGHGMTYAASSMVLCRPLFSSGNWEQVHAAQNSIFQVFRKETKTNSHFRVFTADMLGYEGDVYPAGHWSKGSDTMVILSFLEWFLQGSHLEGPEKLAFQRSVENDEMFSRVLLGVKALHFFHRSLNESGEIFIESSHAKPIASAGYCYLRSYADLSVLALKRGMSLYCIIPKLHYFHHLVHSMWIQANNLPIALNPLVDSTPMNEDFIGHVCRMSRKVSPQCVESSTLERYLARAAQVVEAANEDRD